MRIGVVADDITGSNDIGIMFAKNGLRTTVYPYPHLPSPGDENGTDVFIIDTDSRFDDPETAAGKVGTAAGHLLGMRCDRYFKKTCSVFRGNIGAEFDALLDTVGAAGAAVVAGFPKNGRTTVNSVHYVHGVLLAESQFRNDPANPMTESNLLNLLSGQTGRRILAFTRDLLDVPETERRAIYRALRDSAPYVLFDVRDDRDLETIAELAKDELCLCGSSALAEFLPRAWGIGAPGGAGSGSNPVPEAAGREKTGVLIAAGSLTEQTARQVAYLGNRGTVRFTLDTGKIFDEPALETELSRIGDGAVKALSAGRDVLLRTDADPPHVAETKRLGRELGFDDALTCRRVSTVFAELAAGILERTGIRGLVVAGGDTSSAVSARLGIWKMRIGNEIEPGLPVLYAEGDGLAYRMVLKSGSFGGESFLAKAADRVRGNMERA